MNPGSQKLQVVQVDVFAASPLEGNALAVVLDGTGLTDAQMQAIAKETNLSETTFILPRDSATERERGKRVRIFTVAEELPFAGHPTLGTAFVLRNGNGAGEVKLDLNVGLVPVTFEDRPGEPTFGEMKQIDPEFLAVHDREAVAAVTGLTAADFDPNLPIQTVSTGLRFTLTPIRSLAILSKLRVNPAHVEQYLSQSGGGFFYFVCRDTVDPKARLHARMLFYGGEDPATGSAAGCAASWMVAYGVAQPDERVLIEQGVEMKRPSRIFVRASKRDNRVVNVRVGGNAIEVMRGQMTL
jgi:trans-2,3-dihydro-3-hydroxyanthranilate isomerase